MKKENKKIPSFAQEIEKRSENNFKIVIPAYILIVIIFNVTFIFLEKPTLIEILSIEITLLIVGAIILILWLRTKIPERPERQKNRVLQTIEKMEEKGHIEYEKFEKEINCTIYDIGDYYFSFFWADLFFCCALLLSKIDSSEDFSDDTVMIVVYSILLIFVFYFLVINPIVENKKGIDKIIVDPLNQTFIVRKNILVFFYSRQKLIFPWANVKFKIIPSYNPSREIFNTPDEEKLLVFNEVGEVYRGEKLKIFFSNQFESIVKLFHDDYREIIPKALKSLIEGDQMSKMIALKALSMYDKEVTRRRIISYSIFISIVIIEIILFILFSDFL